MRRIALALALICWASIAWGQVVTPGGVSGDILRSTTVVPVVRPSAANPVSLSCGAGGWANGLWAELIATNDLTTDFVIPTGSGVISQVTGQHWEFDLGTGALGVEVPVATIGASFPGTSTSLLYLWRLPIKFAANTRVSFRCRADQVNTSMSLKVQVYPMPY